jgi:hypothetical protein
MKIEKIASKLAHMTDNLSATEENRKYLDNIRRILGYNLLKGRQDISSLKLPSEELEFAPSEDKIEEFSRYIVTKLHEEDKYLISGVAGKESIPIVGMRVDGISLPINPIESFDELRWNQKRAKEIGPFLSEQGRSISFDLYYFEDKLTVRSQNGSIPHFLFSKAKRNAWVNSFKNTQAVSLRQGHVWILGNLFTSAAGSNEYVGFNITGGTFSLSNKIKWDGQYLEFEADFTGKLTIQLAQSEKKFPSAEGSVPAQGIDFHYPDEVTFEWKDGKLIGITAKNGKFSGYNNELIFKNFDTSVEYISGSNHIFIPSEVDRSKWIADFSQSRIFYVSGEAELQDSFWALPVARVSNPATLGIPENNGGWALKLLEKLSAKWIGLGEQEPYAVLKDSTLLLYPDALFLYSQKTVVDTTYSDEIKENFYCWQISVENPSRIPLYLSFRSNFLLAYYNHATEGETLVTSSMGQIQPDRPIFAEGSRISMKELKGWIIFHVTAAEVKLYALLTNPEVLKNSFKLICLENILMAVSEPAGLLLQGTLSPANHNNIETGQINLIHGLLRWRPILPDPYVSNLQEGWNIKRDSVNGYSSTLLSQIKWERPEVPIVTFNGTARLSSGVKIKPPSGPTINPLPVQLDEQTLKEIKRHTINSKQKENRIKIDSVFDQLEDRLSGIKLLDVSTNMDLIGVSISPMLFGRTDTQISTHAIQAAQSMNALFVLKGMVAYTPLTIVHIFTVPQVQWEPVKTLPEDQDIATLGWFPEYLGSASDGGPTRLIGINHDLAPIIPDLLVHQIEESFTRGNKAAAVTTLSFGLKAIVHLSPLNTNTRNADSLGLVQPDFPKKQLKGGIQINLMAESGIPKSDTRSPGFEGFTSQTLNGYEMFTGTELGLSVLGATLQPDASVETQFNKEFSIDGTDPFVPVTRFDLSGYGASNFSDWDNPHALAQVSKVQFKIIVGRTSFEVVKFVSKIYPWGATVTRSVTIERRTGGGIIRKDSGWQATKAGIFDFRTDGISQPYTFHPGVFRGCFNLKNIRPTSNNIISFMDPNNSTKLVELAPVYFDADLQLDGQLEDHIFARGILGFIQLSPKGETLSISAFQKLIVDQGAIGGPVDTLLDVGRSGFKFRATRFEVDETDTMGTTHFVGVVRGQPLLPHNGSWSVVKIAAPGNAVDPQEAVPADVSRGTPLFIENMWLTPAGSSMNVSSPSGPYRFADPVDLFASQPRFDYGFMQNTGSQALLFRRPVIVSGTNEISSILKPAFADPFAMLTSKGVFPPVANAIEFPTSNYKLLIQSTSGKLRLNTPVNLNNLRMPLVVTQDGADRIAIEYDQSDLRINLNYDDWNVELDNFFIWTSLMGISKFSGTRFSLRAGTSRQAKLINVLSLLKPEIQDALNFLPGMGSPAGVGDIDLGMTNAKHEVKIHTAFETPNLIPAPLDKKIELKLSGSAGVDSEYDPSTAIWQAFFGADVGAELQGKIPIGGIFFMVLGLELEAALGSSVSPTSSSTVGVGFKALEISAYVGIGVGGDIGPFEAEAFLAVGIVFVYEDDTAKLGGLVKLEAEVDLKILSVEISAELTGVIYKDGSDTLCDASGSVAVNVSIFLVINISASYEYQTTERL